MCIEANRWKHRQFPRLLLESGFLIGKFTAGVWGLELHLMYSDRLILCKTIGKEGNRASGNLTNTMKNDSLLCILYILNRQHKDNFPLHTTKPYMYFKTNTHQTNLNSLYLLVLTRISISLPQ